MDEFAHLFEAQAAGLGNAVGLDAGVLGADMRVEAAAGGRNGVCGDRCIRRQAVLGAVIGEVLDDAVAQLLGSRTEVAAAGADGVVTVARRGGARVEVFISGKRLALAGKRGWPMPNTISG